MAKFKYTMAIDDRSGLKVRWRDLRREWTGMMVHKNDWEPRHPQDFPKKLNGPDSPPVPNARPDNDDDDENIPVLTYPWDTDPPYE